jgi:hypothetical protein
MRVKKDKCYLVVSVEKEYVQGAFPYTEEGHKQAKDFLKKITKETKEKYKIKEA